MADFNLAIPIILKHEGGYVNHPNDPGGATNRGIIFRLFKQHAESLGLPKTIEGLKQLTEDQAKTIYKKQFWDSMRGDEIKDQQIANIVFDAFVNMGPRALKMLQRLVKVDSDGIIGPKTLTAINTSNPNVIFNAFKYDRIHFYRTLAERKPEMQVFLKGWLNRINSFNYT